MIDITKLLEIIKKQGATGVLALWLFYTHNEVQELKSKLYECYGKQLATAFERSIESHSYFAIKPEDEINETA
jgi:hypothetical protein